MASELSCYEAVRVAIPDGEDGAELVLDGWVEAISSKTRHRIVLNVALGTLTSLPARVMVRRATPSGIIEYDAVGRDLTEGTKPALTVDLTGNSRSLQRRNSCRVDVGTTTRYRNLSAGETAASLWHKATVGDLSLGGAQINVSGGQIEVGNAVELELLLCDRLYLVPATVCRVGLRADNKAGCFSVQFGKHEKSLHDALGKSLAQAQLRLLSQRLRVE